MWLSIVNKNWVLCVLIFIRNYFFTDILKNTPKSNPDYAALEDALAKLREVMTHINEDKRKTEGQRVLFDIFNDIDNCPVSII